MDKLIQASSFTTLAGNLRRPFPPSRQAKKSPYALPEEELFERYGMRQLTPEERKVFSGLKLVITVKKVQITKAPSILPKTKGWIVWIAETYPKSYLVNFPGGGSVLAPFNKMSWVDVPQDTPATTLESAKEGERQRRWQLVFKRDINTYLVVT